jgi:hypothetical protein
MKKKLSPRELREAKRQEQTAKRAQAQAERELELAKQQEAQEAAEFRSKLPPKNKRKSLTKAIGMKSALVVGDSVVITSFGKGNDAVFEKKIESCAVVDLNPANPAFSVDDVTEKKFTLAHGRIKGCIATADDPMYSAAAPRSAIVTRNSPAL